MEENNQEPGISKYVPLLDEPSASAKLKRIEQNYQTIKSQSLEINNQIEQNNEILGRINRQMSSMNTRLTRASNQARLLAVRAIGIFIAK